MALFGTILTGRLSERLADVSPGAPSTGTASGDVGSLTPATVAALPEAVRTGVVDAFADALAPALWYLVPLLAAGLVLTLFLGEVGLSDVAGMVARGEAVAAPHRADGSTPTLVGEDGVAVGIAAAGALAPSVDGPLGARAGRRCVVGPPVAFGA